MTLYENIEALEGMIGEAQAEIRDLQFKVTHLEAVRDRLAVMDKAQQDARAAALAG